MINLVNGNTHWGRRFEGNICRQHRIVHLLALLRPNEQYQQISWGCYLTKKLLFYIWGNKTISRSLTLSLAVFLPWGLCICVSCDVLDVHNVLAYWLIVIVIIAVSNFIALFHLVQFIKCCQFSLELNSKRLYRCSGKEKESRCLVFTSFHKTWN